MLSSDPGILRAHEPSDPYDQTSMTKRQKACKKEPQAASSRLWLLVMDGQTAEPPSTSAHARMGLEPNISKSQAGRTQKQGFMLDHMYTMCQGPSHMPGTTSSLVTSQSHQTKAGRQPCQQVQAIDNTIRIDILSPRPTVKSCSAALWQSVRQNKAVRSSMPPQLDNQRNWPVQHQNGHASPNSTLGTGSHQKCHPRIAALWQTSKMQQMIKA